jgi:hypothetical protein
MPSYDYIASHCCYGEFSVDTFQRMVERRREVWFGEDGSGLIRDQKMRSTFFTEQQRRAWETDGHTSRRDSCDVTLDVFRPGEFFGPRRQLAGLAAEPQSILDTLERTRSMNLSGIHQPVGEALVPAALRPTLFELAGSLPEAETVQGAQDELKRPGIGIARDERGHREELIFDLDTLELLGYRQVILDPDCGYAPVGSVVGYSSYLNRSVVAGLPDGTPAPPDNN